MNEIIFKEKEQAESLQYCFLPVDLPKDSTLGIHRLFGLHYDTSVRWIIEMCILVLFLLIVFFYNFTNNRIIRNRIEHWILFRGCRTNVVRTSSVEGTPMISSVVLGDNRFHTKVNLSNKRITSQECKELIANYLNDSTITHLNLSNNLIGDEGCKLLTRAFLQDRSNGYCSNVGTTLTTNSDGVASATTVANASAPTVDPSSTATSTTPNNTDGNKAQLSELDLSANRIRDEGITAIADALISNKTLLRLNLSSNNLIGTNGMIRLFDSLRINETLTDLNLSCTGITCDHCQALSVALRCNHSITHLSLESNRISDTGCIELANALAKGNGGKRGMYYTNSFSISNKNNQTLMYLNLGCNRIGLDGCQAFARALETNYSLKTLNFNFNYGLCRGGGYTIQEKIRFYLELNEIGRREILLSSCNNNDPVIETLIKVSHRIDLFYYFLHSKPDVCMCMDTVNQSYKNYGKENNHDTNMENNCKDDEIVPAYDSLQPSFQQEELTLSSENQQLADSVVTSDETPTAT